MYQRQGKMRCPVHNKPLLMCNECKDNYLLDIQTQYMARQRNAKKQIIVELLELYQRCKKNGHEFDKQLEKFLSAI